MKTTFNTDKESGLTLIELIVAIGLFGLLSVFVTGAFMNIMSVKAQAEEKQQIMNDFRVALDLMGREIRSGRAFPQAEEGVSRISFMSRVRTDLPWKFNQYELQNGRIMKGQRDTQGFCNLRTEYDEEGRAYGAFDPDCLFPFTSDRVNVRDLTFYIHNFDPDEHYGFPLITIAVKGEVLVGDTRHSFKTSVSYSPRQALNPEFRIPTDTTPPRVDIRMVDGYLLGDGDRQGGVKFKQVDTGIVSLSGRAWDPGGSGIKKVTIRNEHPASSYSSTIDFPDCGQGSEDMCQTDIQWTFGDVELITGMTENRIVVIAFDQWDSTGSDRIIIKSTLPPVKPLPPDFDLRAVCSTDSADLDHVRIEIEGKEQDVRYYDSYEIEKNSVSLGLTSADDNGNLLYIDTGVDAGIEYEYRVRAVNTEWDSDSHIYSNWTDPAIAQKDCLPTITGFTAQARCSRYGEPYVRGCVDDQGGDIVTSTNLLRVFRLLPSYLFIEEDHTKHLCQWTDPPGVQSNGIYIGPGDGLSAGNYTYRAQGCLGSGTDEVCVDFPEDRTVSFATNACVPPDSVMERFGPLMCTFEGGNPTVSYDINVGYIAEALRNFTKYLVYQCNDSVCGNRTLVGVCDREEEVSSQYCTTVHHLRSILPATYRYAVRTYNEAYETDSYEDEYALGPLSDVEEIYVEDICDYDWEGSERVNISANLECRYDDSYFEGTASENDFRRIVVSVDDPDNPDTSSVYKVYKCTSEDFVTCAPLDQCSLSGAGQCAVDEGPDDNTTHYYMVEMCDWEGKNCSSPRSASEYVEGDACVPTVPQIDKEEIEHSGCVAPDAEYQRIKLRAFSYDRQNTSIYIKTFRDGGSGNNLAQGQWGFDDNARIGETYTYGFQACNELLEPGFDCGDVHEVEYKVTANVCPPKTPERLEMTDVDCNEDGYLSGVTLLAGDSDYHDGFEIERSDPVSPTFSCSYESDYYNAESCTDVFDPPISSAVNYYYRARSYRDTLKSDWTDELAASLDPYVLCGAPFELKREKSYIIITVTDSDIGGGTVTSDYEVVDIEPREGFTGTVYFSEDDMHIELTDVMKAFITEEDVSFNLVNTEVDYPYEKGDRFRFNITVPDYDYLQGETQEIGAYITVYGSSGDGFVTGVGYSLIIRLEGGQTQ